MTPTPPLVLHDHDAAGMHELRRLLLAVYTEVYADLLGDLFFAPDRFWERLEAYAKWPGFELVTGWINDELIVAARTSADAIV